MKTYLITIQITRLGNVESEKLHKIESEKAPIVGEQQRKGKYLHTITNVEEIIIIQQN